MTQLLTVKQVAKRWQKDENETLKDDINKIMQIVIKRISIT